MNFAETFLPNQLEKKYKNRPKEYIWQWFFPAPTLSLVKDKKEYRCLQENYDIRTIQELLGHSDIRTTMKYTHTLQSRTIKQAKSPLDFTSESK